MTSPAHVCAPEGNGLQGADQSHPVERTATLMASTLPSLPPDSVEGQLGALDRGLLEVNAKVDYLLRLVQEATTGPPRRPELHLIQGGRA
jgi:hypothetical protein